MKTSALVSLLFCLLFSAAQLHADTLPGDIRVVVSEKRIFFVADETPYTNLSVKIKDNSGKTLIQKQFNSKNADWSLDVSQLPQGNYTLLVGEHQNLSFQR
jgi:hypothetical protein